ncbi:hypothetical protein ACWGNA_12195 [Brucella cytisi]|uniref:hypothetical protein n=1 Tax=Brucella cytisi TaxID=407152 RepID=UPI0035D85272
MAAFQFMGWPEQFVEEITEPRLEQLDLGWCERQLIGPVIGDGPGLAIGAEVLRERAALGAPGTAMVVLFEGSITYKAFECSVAIHFCQIATSGWR